MKTATRILTFTAFTVIATALAITGCDRHGQQGQKQSQSSEFAPERVGLPASAVHLGPDEKGRHWYGPEGSTDGEWMYDPKDKTLYTAKKNEKTGEWDLTAKPEVTPASLGLPASTVEYGKDPNGFYWFEIPGQDGRLVYRTAAKTLHRAKKNAKGEWEIETAVAPKP